MTRAWLFLAAAAFAQAAGAIHWDELPKALKGQTIQVSTIQGGLHEGRFAGSRPDTLLLKEGQTVEISRESIISIRRVYHVHGNHLKKFGDCLGDVVGVELLFLVTEYFPLGVVALPVTGAVGLAALPILAIWDTFDRQRREENIVLLPDPAPEMAQ
jgi:hypothetical protein